MSEAVAPVSEAEQQTIQEPVIAVREGNKLHAIHVEARENLDVPIVVEEDKTSVLHAEALVGMIAFGALQGTRRNTTTH